MSIERPFGPNEPFTAYRGVLKIHNAVRSKKAGYFHGWLKQPPEVDASSGGILNCAYVFGEWSEWIFEVASYKRGKRKRGEAK